MDESEAPPSGGMPAYLREPVTRVEAWLILSKMKRLSFAALGVAMARISEGNIQVAIDQLNEVSQQIDQALNELMEQPKDSADGG